jgi:hypothetical protein
MHNLHCRCGEYARHIDVIERTGTGLEVHRFACHKCGRISWWHVVYTPEYRSMLVDQVLINPDAPRSVHLRALRKHDPKRVALKKRERLSDYDLDRTTQSAD